MRDEGTLIIGGGIVGLSAAYFLARRGVAVTVLEQNTIDQGASTGNAGLIAPGHGPLPRPGLAAEALKWIFDPLNPLYIPFRVNVRRWRWLLAFHRACAPSHHAYCLAALLAHGREAGACFRALVDEERIECAYRPTGQLDVFLTEEGLRRGEAEAAKIAKHGYTVEVLDGHELRRREPAYRDTVAGAVLFGDRAFANPRAFMVELGDRAARHGATILPDQRVDRLVVEGDRCTGAVTVNGDHHRAANVVLAAGSWSTALARTAGVRVPMEAGKGYHLDVTVPSSPLTTAALLAETFVAVNPVANVVDGNPRGHLRFAGTLEFSGINHRIVQRRVDMLLIGARKYLHGLDDATPRASWCGLRPCTADGLPVVGFVRPGLFVATGHAMMGFTLGPLAGRIAAECIVDGRPSVDIEPFDAARFGSRSTIDASR